MTSWVVTTHADMKSIELRPRPLASISPRSGSIAALAKWNITAQTRKITSGRSWTSAHALSAFPAASPSLAPRASSWSISAGRISSRTESVGTASAATKKKMLRFDTR